jgi:hypothetical protein
MRQNQEQTVIHARDDLHGEYVAIADLGSILTVILAGDYRALQDAAGA